MDFKPANLDGFYKVACRDADLIGRIRTVLGEKTPISFVDPASTDLPCRGVVIPLCARLIGGEHARYSGSARGLRLAFVETDELLAIATWQPHCDWIVVGTALLERLHLGARAVADLLQGEIQNPYSDTPIEGAARALADHPSFHGEFSSLLDELFFAIGLTFIICHEIGHHVRGHDGYLASTSEVVVEHEIWGRSDLSLDHFAIELDADNFATGKALRLAWDYLMWRFENFQQGKVGLTEQMQFAHLASVAVFISLFVIVPGNFAATMLNPSAQHPAGEFRALWLAHDLIAGLASRCPALEEAKELNAVVLFGLAAVVAAFLACSRRVDSSQEGISMRDAFRISGITRIMFDENVSEFVRKIADVHAQLQRRFRPR